MESVSQSATRAPRFWDEFWNVSSPVREYFGACGLPL
jgi:hypothetical protein